jgi:hypothetical protein
MGPQALGIGAQKAGTTTVWEVLRRQPWFAAPDHKEINFFSGEYARGEQWYRDRFRGPRDGTISADISPSYLRYPIAARRAYAFDPRLRIFVILRDPVQRAFSAFLHLRRIGEVDGNVRFAEFLPMQSSFRARGWPVIADGCYAELLTPWLERFGLQQVHVLFFEELIADPGPAFEGLFRHLGAPPGSDVPVTAETLPHVNPARATRSPELSRILAQAALRMKGRGYVRVSRAFRRNLRLIEDRAGADRLPSLAAEDREHLQQVYAAHDAALERLLGRSLPW